MAGTDSTIPDPNRGVRAPAVILVRPQLGENIGMCCRAMMNSGLSDLRLVVPREPWPSVKGRAAASGADALVDSARVFASTAEAVADLQKVYAATARPRDSVQPVVVPRQAAAELRACASNDMATGILFGPEAKGLANDDVVQADTIVAVPLNPAFKSLNLAQAVFCIGYEWYQTDVDVDAFLETSSSRETRPATKKELTGMFEHLEQELDDCGFLQPPEKRPTMVRNIRTMFQRADLTEQEVRTMRGVISGLTRRHERNRKT